MTDGDGEEKEPELVVSVPHVQQQQGNTDCGLFAIAFILHVALGDDLESIIFNQSQMHPHLLKCFQKKKLEAFPHEKVATIHMKEFYFPYRLYCTCFARIL